MGKAEMTGRAIEDRLVGSWSLVSYVRTFSDGRADLLPMGAKPRGLLLYTGDGFMSAQLGPALRPNFGSEVITDGTMEEFGRAARTYIAYTGRFSCDDERATVTHHVHASIFPNWVGSQQVRKVVFDGGLLGLRSLSGAAGNELDAIQALTWRRTDWS